MPSDYGGTITALNGLLPSFVHVSSSTNASPISVTTTAPHGAETGDTVVIDAHLVNTAANGSWEVVVTSATTLLLVGSTGNGVGGATGTLRNAGFGSLFQIPSGTDALSAASVNVALEALGDRTALLLYLLNFKQQVYAGGRTTYHEDSILELASGSVLQGDGGSALLGTFTLGDGAGGSLFQVAAHSAISLEASGAFTTAAGSIVSILGDLEISGAATFELAVEETVQGTGSIRFQNNATLRFNTGSIVTGNPTFTGVTIAAGSDLTFGGAAATSSLNIAKTGIVLTSTTTIADSATTTGSNRTIAGTQTDSSSTTRSGPTVRSGALAYVGGRSRLLIGADANQTINPWEQDIIQLTGAISANHNWTFNDPPNGERVEVLVIMNTSELGTNHVQIKDSSSANVVRFDGIADGTNKWGVLRWDAGVSTWICTMHCAQDFGGVI